MNGFRLNLIIKIEQTIFGSVLSKWTIGSYNPLIKRLDYFFPLIS